MDKVLQAAKLVWPQISEDTNILPIRRDAVIIPIVEEPPSAEWFDASDPEWWKDFEKKLEERLEYGQVTIKLERYDGLDFEAGYDDIHDILVVRAGQFA